MSQLGEWLFQKEKDTIEAALAASMPRTAIVATISGSRITVTDPRTGTVETELLSVLGPLPLVGDRVAIFPLSDGARIAAKISGGVVIVPNGVNIEVYSDAGVTPKFIIRGTDGNIFFGPATTASASIGASGSSPEGSASRQAGSLWLNTNGGFLDALWFKADGIGNSGWAAVDGFVRTRWESGWHKDHGATTISTMGMPAVTVTGTAVNSDTGNGQLLTLTTGAVSGNTAGVNTPNVLRTSQGFESICRIFAETTITLIRFWNGFFSGSPVASDAPALEYAAWRASTGTADANWKCVTSNGVGGQTVVDSGIPFAASTFLNLRIVSLNGTAFRFYNGETFITEITTNLPGTSTSLAYYSMITTLSAATRNFRVSFLRLLTR